METLLSTIAQISFTVVSLFFVALTVDSDSRNRWFGQYPENHYVRLNLVVMLLPAFLSLGALINLEQNTFPSWIVTSTLLLVVSTLVYIELRKLKTVIGYERIANLEKNLSSANVVISNVVIFFVLSLFGFASAYIHDLNHLAEQENVLKTFVCALLLDSILPIIAFTRENTNHKFHTLDHNTESISRGASVEVSGLESSARSSGGIFYISVLTTAFIAFILGLFLNKD